MASPLKKPRYEDDQEIRLVVSKDLFLHESANRGFGITKKWIEEFNPTNTTDQATFYRFSVETSDYVLMNPGETYLKCSFRIMKKTNQTWTPIATTDKKVLPINMLGSGFFKGINVKLNGYQVESLDDNYGYRANFEKTLLYPSQVKRNNMESSLFFHEDEKWDAIKTDIDFDFHDYQKNIYVKDNEVLQLNKPLKDYTPFLKRRKIASGGNQFTTIDVIHSDLFNQSKWLPPKTSLELRFTKHPIDGFCLLEVSDDEETTTFKIELVKVNLMVTMAEIEKGFMHSIREKTEGKEKEPYKIPIRRVEMTTHHYPANTSEFSKTSAFVKDGLYLPRRVFLGFVNSKAFHGSHHRDPFYYHDINATSVFLKVGGQIVPYSEMRCTRSGTKVKDHHKNDDVVEYATGLQMATGTFNTNQPLGINRLNWSRGNALFGFDLTSADEQEAFSMPKYQTVEFTCKVQGTDSDNAYVMVVMAEYDSEIQIDKDGVVTLVKEING